MIAKDSLEFFIDTILWVGFFVLAKILIEQGFEIIKFDHTVTSQFYKVFNVCFSTGFIHIQI